MKDQEAYKMAPNDRGGVCVRTCVFFTHMLYVIALSDISFCSFELQASAIMQEWTGHKEHKNQRDKGIRESERAIE